MLLMNYPVICLIHQVIKYRKEFSLLKIHIVQKGDTLWNLAQKYGVSFEEVKQLNAQLANPDQIMLGMKIKIPTSTKQVQKQPSNDKIMHPYKDTSKKAQPVMYEDDIKKPSPIKKQMPAKVEPMPMPMPMPQQPIQLPELPNFHSTNYNFDVDIEDNDTEINQQSVYYTEQPVQQQQPMQPVYYVMQPMQPMPMQPCNSCMPSMQPMQPMPYPQPQYQQQQMPSFAPNPMQQPKYEQPLDPCEQFQSPENLMHGYNNSTPYPSYQKYGEMESSSIEMPPMPMNYSQQPSMPMEQEAAQWAPDSNGYPGYTTMPNQMPQGMQPGMQMPLEMQQGMWPSYPMPEGGMAHQGGAMPQQMGGGMPFQPMPQMGSPYPFRMTEDDEEDE